MPTSIPLTGPLKGALLVDRPDRVTVRAALEPESTVVIAHLSDPGEHAALLAPDHRVWLRPTEGPQGLTSWQVVIVQSLEGTLVLLEPNTVGNLVHAALQQEVFPELDGWYVERIDVPIGRSRVPFQLSTYAGEKMLVALLTVTRSENGVAIFPDGRHETATRVLRELAAVPERPGFHASAIFMAPRNDVTSVAANEMVDPDFADALRAAKRAGVRLIGRRGQITLAEAMLGVEIPVNPWNVPIRG